MAAPTVSEENDEETAGAPAGLHLFVMGPQQTATHRLPSRGSVSIGRDEDSDVRVVDEVASRHHARLHLEDELRIEIEDVGSSNGTCLRDQPLEPRRRVPLAPGDAITIGSTVLLIRRREPAFKGNPVRSHGHFEARLIEECARAESVKGNLAVMRLHLDPPGLTPESLLANAIRSGDVLAAYGPNEYEILLVDTGRLQAEALANQIETTLERAGVPSRGGMAFFPQDGTSPQALVTRACDRVRGTEHAVDVGGSMVLENQAMRDLYAQAAKVAKGTISVLILGETGAGKELLAESVHRLSPRAQGPFVSVNCAALAETLLEAELFGYEKGAFTGASALKVGLLESAHGGTLFLDEVGEMSLVLQKKMLRALETRTITRIGATKALPVDVRFVAATNVDLEEEVAAKRFREDLYFRLNAAPLTVPPLRERPDEIEPLARRFLRLVAEQMGQPVPALSSAALALLRSYAWPGNIRELRNDLERAVLLCSGLEIAPEHLPLEKMSRRPASTLAAAPTPELPAPPPSHIRDVEKQAILEALRRCAGNQTRAAELLGMPRRTFCKKVKDFEIPRPRARGSID